MSRLAIKVDVDTDRGTRDGVLPLARLLAQRGVPALFLFSLGPDNMGKSIFRIFQPGFFKKVARTRVASQLGARTLLNGTLLPAPKLGRRHESLMREVRAMGFETGVHCNDHYRWQNHVQRMSLEQTRDEFAAAAEEFTRIFKTQPCVAGAPGWQCTPYSLDVYDEFKLLYASDTRGTCPFRPSMGGRSFATPQLPTTLPTLDELLGRPAYPDSEIVGHYIDLLTAGPPDHVLTIHAEMEGLHYLPLFEALLDHAQRLGIEFYSLEEQARQLRQRGMEHLPINSVEMAEIDGRSGVVATQLVSEVHQPSDTKILSSV